MTNITRQAIEAVRDYVVDEFSCRLEADYYGNQVIRAAEAHLEREERDRAPRLPLNEFFERPDDMGQGRLRMILDGDSDVIVEIINTAGESLSLEFCTSIIGGGRSPKVRNALYLLAQAIQEENNANPIAI